MTPKYPKCNFCNTYEGLKNTYSMARAKMVSKAFPKSACLVVPGHSSNNYRHIPENWKNGDQDLSVLEGAAYILGQKTRPTGSHLLLVSQKELTREAELALLSIKQKKDGVETRQPKYLQIQTQTFCNHAAFTRFIQIQQPKIAPF